MKVGRDLFHHLLRVYLVSSWPWRQEWSSFKVTEDALFHNTGKLSLVSWISCSRQQIACGLSFVLKNKHWEHASDLATQRSGTLIWTTAGIKSISEECEKSHKTSKEYRDGSCVLLGSKKSGKWDVVCSFLFTSKWNLSKLLFMVTDHTRQIKIRLKFTEVLL